MVTKIQLTKFEQCYGLKVENWMGCLKQYAMFAVAKYILFQNAFAGNKSGGTKMQIK